MKRTVRVAALALTFSALAIPSLAARASGLRETRPTGVQAVSLAAQKVLNDSNFPAAFTFGPQGGLFFADRFSGEIRLKLTVSSSRLVFTVTNLSTDGEQGLLGIALDPNYPTSPYLYAYAPRRCASSANALCSASPESAATRCASSRTRADSAGSSCRCRASGSGSATA